MSTSKQISNFFKTLLGDTRNGSQKWKVTLKGDWSSYTTNPTRIHRSFETQLNEDTKAILIVKTLPHYNEDFDTEYDRVSYELLVLQKASITEPYLLLSLIDNNYVPEEMFRQLYEVISEENEQAKDFFGKYK